jgi:hypothetical protein
VRKLGALGVLALSLITAACTSTPSSSSTTTRPSSSSVPTPGTASRASSTVIGQMIQVGGPAGAPDVVVHGAITLTSVSSGVSYHTSATRKHGYSIVVPPGTYRVTGSSLDDFSDGHPMAAYGRQPVLVSAGATVRVDLYVQIR